MDQPAPQDPFATLPLRVDQILRMSEAQEAYPCPSNIRTQILGIVFPEHTSEVQKIVQWANETKTAIYPISTGNNWGYGGGHPVMEGSVIVDLGRMNRILDFDAELGIVTVEPGVSQGQLYKFLKEKKADYYVPVTGSSPYSSLIGNALERGYGVTPITNHLDAIIALDVVLPDGDRHTTPTISVPTRHQTELDLCFKGFFSQSSFGIVTSATLQLITYADAHCILLFAASDPQTVEKFIDQSRMLSFKHRENVTSVKFFNQAYSVSLDAAFPQEFQNAPGFDLNNWVDQIARRTKSPLWFNIVFVSGSKRDIQKTISDYQKTLRPLASQAIVFNATMITLMRIGAPILGCVPFAKKLSRKVKSMVSLDELMHGKPQKDFLNTAYWRAGAPSQIHEKPNPGRDGAGLIWFAPIIPFRGFNFLEFESLIKQICTSFGFLPTISMTTLSDRSIAALVPILFDPKTESDKAHTCYDALFQACKSAGYLPYRGHIHHLTQFTSPETNHYWHALQKIKSSLDPRAILSPGRYDAQPSLQNHLSLQPATPLPEDVVDIQTRIRQANQDKTKIMIEGYVLPFLPKQKQASSAKTIHISHLDKIIDFSDDLGIITVQPGVSARDIQVFIEKTKAPFYPDISPGNLTHLKVVLPDGSIYQSLLSDRGGEEIDRAYRWGTGPSFDSFFILGNCGVIIEMSFALVPMHTGAPSSPMSTPAEFDTLLWQRIKNILDPHDIF